MDKLNTEAAMRTVCLGIRDAKEILENLPAFFEVLGFVDEQAKMSYVAGMYSGIIYQFLLKAFGEAEATAWSQLPFGKGRMDE